MKKLTLFVVSLLFFPTLALAFTAGAGEPADLSDDAVHKLALTLWQYLVDKKWGAAAGPALMLFVWALKKWDLVIFNAIKLPKVAVAVDKFLDQPFVSFLLPTVASGVAGFSTALLTGHSFVDALGAVWAASSTAITTYIGLKKFDEQMKAGDDAAKTVAAGGKSAAIDELKK